ncbi:hypothetical protein DXV75_07500 [Alteromonas aestuariivivens]|uniref:Uncharacterized protein n=1 Tax=Alteromonas aestuariivivens TaxID=1938339 RepID=A0A3D8MBN4_9ALTE|nr:hypothetical protein DXV75_07500 [Alteromonas aestuariivivens]
MRRVIIPIEYFCQLFKFKTLCKTTTALQLIYTFFHLACGIYFWRWLPGYSYHVQPENSHGNGPISAKPMS